MTSSFCPASRGAASAIARFNPAEPWLPPKRRSRRVPERAETGGIAKNSPRTGVPVTTPGLARRAFDRSSPTAVRVAKRLRSRVAMPGSAYESWTSVGMPRARAMPEEETPRLQESGREPQERQELAGKALAGKPRSRNGLEREARIGDQPLFEPPRRPHEQDRRLGSPRAGDPRERYARVDVAARLSRHDHVCPLRHVSPRPVRRFIAMLRMSPRSRLRAGRCSR